MNDREIMKLALEALEGLADYRYTERVKETMSALTERLAPPEQEPAPTNCRHCGGAENVICAGQCKEQPEQEPVAWGVFDGPNLHDMFFTEQDAQEMVRLKGDGSTVKPLYIKEKNNGN